jgi:hypothetical protein
MNLEDNSDFVREEWGKEEDLKTELGENHIWKLCESTDVEEKDLSEVQE